MPFCPEKTLLVYQAKEVYKSAEEKNEMRRRMEAGMERRDQVSTLFRVRLGGVKNFNVVVAMPEDTPFEEAALKMSSVALSMLLTRLRQAEKSHVHNVHVHVDSDPPSSELYKTTFRVTVNDMTRSLMNTMLDESTVILEILVGGRVRDRIPYTIRWLQYPLEAVTIPFSPREGFPLAALVEPTKGAKFHVPPTYRNAPSYPFVLRYCWFTMEVDSEKSDKGKVKQQDKIEWVQGESGLRPQLQDAQFVCEAASFTPREEHVGKYIAVTASCLPAARLNGDVTAADSDAPPSDVLDEPLWTVMGRSMEVVLGRSVDEELLAASKIQWAEKDEKDREESGDKSRLRLVSYNLLADQYIILSLPQAKLFYPYVDKKYQNMRYRYSLHLKELEGYAADLYFLQEVCLKMSFHYLPALFHQRNFGYAFQRKYMKVRESSGIVWNKARFEQKKNVGRWLTDVLKDEENGDIRELLLRAAPEDRKFFENRPTLVHVMQLTDVVTGDEVIVGNTHLHHDPRHEHYKASRGALQTALVARKLASCVRKAREEMDASVEGEADSGRATRCRGSIRVLLGADLNSTPEAAALGLLSRGFIGKDDPVWDADERMGGMELRLPEELRGMVNLSGEPPFTNYTVHPSMNEGELENKGFAGCIDYIWACGVETVAVSEQPTMEEIARHTALPSPIAPSDHLAIVLSARYCN